MRNKILEGLTKNPLIAGITAFLVMLLITVLITYQRYQLFKQARTRELFNTASQVKVKLESCIRQATAANSTLSYIVKKYGIENDFNEVAEKILDDNGAIDAIELVRNGKITNIYPLKGNTEKERGGKAIVERNPIIINDALWGYSVSIIQMSTLLNQIRLDNKFNKNFVFQLSKKNPETGKEEFFLNTPEPLKNNYPVSVQVPEGNWIIYAKFSSESPILTSPPILILGILSAILVGLITYYLCHRPIELRRQVLEKTNQLRINQEIILHEKQLSDTIIKGLPGIFYVAHKDGKLIRWNKNLEEMSGYNAAELKDLQTTDLVEEGQIEMIREKKKEAFRTGRASEKVNVINKSKQRFIYYVTIMPIRYNNEECLLGIGIDITEQTEKEKQLSKAITEAQEMERMQISMEIHDNVKQIMAACLLNLDFVNSQLDNRDLAQQGIARIRNYMGQSMEELRRISHQLAPSADSLDLEEKVEGLILAMNVSKKLRIFYRFNSTDKRINNEVQIALYRILQEQVSNILKYAEATTVNIDLKRENGDLYMSVRDNGKGFDTSRIKSGIGLENIRRRAHVLNGDMTIVSSPGSGCDLIVKIPVGKN